MQAGQHSHGLAVVTSMLERRAVPLALRNDAVQFSDEWWCAPGVPDGPALRFNAPSARWEVFLPELGALCVEHPLETASWHGQ